MTDASGTVVWAADYKPFGEAIATVSTVYVQNAPTRYSDPPGLLGWDTVIKQIFKQVGKKLGKKAADSGEIDSEIEGDDDKDGIANFRDPDYPPNKPCMQCHSGPVLPTGPPCQYSGRK